MSSERSSAPSSTAAPEFVTGTHHALSAWFLGPKAENSQIMKQLLGEIVDRVARSRLEYFPEDPVCSSALCHQRNAHQSHRQMFITASAQNSAPYKHEINNLQRYTTLLTDLLSRYNPPFFSPRYMGHMCFDNSMPATLGYLTAMLHNPNNVAVEASPLTSYVEHCVGQQLCKMLGYHTKEDIAAAEDAKSSYMYKAWGHLTCDGSVANLEAMW